VLVYIRSIGGYVIACKKCGEVRGSSESRDPKFLAALSRNERLAEGQKTKAARKSKRR
jgi:hypothetical protein